MNLEDKALLEISCSERYESVISHQGGLKPMLGEGFITPDNVQKKSYFHSKIPNLQAAFIG